MSHEARHHAEQAVLGAILIAPSRVMDIARRNKIDAGWFTTEPHRAIWTAASGMEPLRVDLFTVGQKLGTDVSAKQIEDCVEACPSQAHAEYYIETLRSHWMRDQARVAFLQAVEKLQTDEDPQIVISRAQADLARLAPPDAKRTIKDVYQSLMDRWTGKMAVDQVMLPSRFPSLNKRLGGYRRGKLYIIAAQRKNGKTTMLCNETLHFMKAGIRVSIASLEMDEEEMRGRILCEDADVSTFQMDTKQGTEIQFSRIGRVYDQHHQYPLRVCDESMTADRFSAWATNEVVTHGAQVLGLDYLQIISSASNHKTESRQVEVSTQVNAIRDTIKRLNVPLLMLSQLSRTNEHENRPPTLRDLRDSGTIEQAAYASIFLHREKLTDENFDWSVQGHRGGPNGNFPMTFESNRQRFCDPPAAQRDLTGGRE